LIKYFIGPMSKNVVDSIIEVDDGFGFIPSRRQVDYNGGYVNSWTTGEFATYVNGRVPIERDHGGIGQGYKHDDGIESYMHDCRYFDKIHIDPWKEYQDFDKGLQETIDCINFIYLVMGKKEVKFEVGTEESIRRFEVDELENLLRHLKGKLEPEIFENIEYVVVQSGVGLDLGKQNNSGTFDPDRLENMINICKKFGKKSKEHNGDYLSNDEYKVRFDMGLDSINIAPEFGQLETLCYLEEMDKDIDEYYNICYDSKRWKKWVNDDFVPEDNKKELIKICGHYVFSNRRFLDIKPNIDDKIKTVIKNKLRRLNELT
tara:strand:+ start:4029 stop:4979 length:951 start_codon:yes stop_codon:yes gene_type:complete